jgi:uncharacterized protein (TIGR03083 family)
MDLDHWHRYGAERTSHHANRLIAMVQELDDAELAATVPGMRWTAQDVFAHVVTVWRRYTVNPERAETWRDVARANAKDLASINHDLDFLIEDLRAQTATMLTFADRVPPTMPLPFHAGQTLTLAGGWGNALNELLIHGDDIARATNRQWDFDAADLEPFWRFTSGAWSGFLSDHGRTADDRWLLDFGFGDGPVHIRFIHGEVRMDEPGEPDYVVAGDPVEITLTMPWRRRPTTDPAMLEFIARFEEV